MLHRRHFSELVTAWTFHLSHVTETSGGDAVLEWFGGAAGETVNECFAVACLNPIKVK